jgi:hypothetical protein
MVLNGMIGALGVVALVQAVLLWRATRALGRLHTIEARVEKFGDALTLLTDTTESAFRAVASEISRTPATVATPTRTTSATRTARVARAAKRGRSVTDIAATEEMAESEVRLRLHMANDEAPVAPAKRTRKAPVKVASKGREVTRGAVRLD